MTVCSQERPFGIHPQTTWSFKKKSASSIPGIGSVLSGERQNDVFKAKRNINPEIYISCHLAADSIYFTWITFKQLSTWFCLHHDHHRAFFRRLDEAS